jgi:NAD(P)-dependent dehydrogenase (short-subunit alcohol dehydrogenase family)
VSPLAGRLAVITGASRGIGAAVCSSLAGAGARVLRVARSFPGPGPGGVVDLPCDLTDARQIAELGRLIRKQFGSPDIVVNNAGGFLLRPLEDTAVEDFDAQVTLNLRAPFALARTFLPMLREAGRGCFISVGSIADHVGFPDNAAYAATKYGLRGLHETLLAEYRGSGVRCCLVSPGPTDTAVWDAVDLEGRPGIPRRADMLRPADVADAILFVATRPPHVQVDWLRVGPL